MKIQLLILFTLTLLQGCNPTGLLSSGVIKFKQLQDFTPNVRTIKVASDLIIVKGQGFSDVISAKLEGHSQHTFKIVSKSSDELILEASTSLKLLLNSSLNLVLSSAHASASFPITIELQNGQVSALHLSHMGATTGQFLRFNGTNWAPGNVNSSLHYLGTYDALTDTPDIVATGGSSGSFYIVTVSGTRDFGNGPETLNPGDWVIYDGTDWSSVPIGGNSVASFNGRRGIVTPLLGDYSWSMLTKSSGKLTGSKVSDIADVDITGIQDGHVLKWNQTSSKWIDRKSVV